MFQNPIIIRFESQMALEIPKTICRNTFDGRNIITARWKSYQNILEYFLDAQQHHISQMKMFALHVSEKCNSHGTVDKCSSDQDIWYDSR